MIYFQKILYFLSEFLIWNIDHFKALSKFNFILVLSSHYSLKNEKLIINLGLTIICFF
jgi:hypothetical protein